MPIYNIPQPKELYNSAKTQNTISKDFTHLNISKHICLNVDPPLYNHPEPSTLIVKLLRWHQSAREYKRSIICEKARVYSTSISKHVKMQCNQQPTHQTHRSTWITISKRLQNIRNIHKIKDQIPCASLQHSTMLQQFYNSAKIQNKISKEFTHLKDFSE